MNKYSKLVIGTVVALLTVPAAAKSPFYIGADIGGAYVKDRVAIINEEFISEESLPTNRLAGNINVGADINEYFAVELGYFTTGKAKKDLPFGLKASTQYSAPTLDLIGNIPVSDNLSVLGSVGAAYVQADFEDSLGKQSAEDVRIKLGAGLKWKLNDSFAVRTKVDYIDVGTDVQDGLWLYTAGVQYHL